MWRKMTDLGVILYRQMVRVYGRDVRAFHLVRLLNEETLRRCLLGSGDSVRKSSFCTLALTLRKVEVKTMNLEMNTEREEVLQWSTLCEDNVTKIAKAVAECKSSLEFLPSFESVMSQRDLRIEVLSLMEVKVPPEAIAMSQEEVRRCIEVNGSHVDEGASIPGIAEQSSFAAIFEGSGKE